jgi:hypothetical protein
VRPGRVVHACLLALAMSPGVAAAQATGPLNTLTLPRAPVATVEVRPVLPAWVALPPTARILTSEGLEMRPLRNAAVTWENAKVGVLVGALTNAGGCARDVRVFLQYVDDGWKPLDAPLESEARVSTVEPGALLPYRFRLKRVDDFEVPPSGYILQVAEGDRPVAGPIAWVSASTRRGAIEPCPTAAASFTSTITRSRATLSGYRVEGSLAVTSGGTTRPDAIAVTALLRDEAGDVLEVLTGVPAVKDAAAGVGPGVRAPFTLSTPIPLGKAVTDVLVFVESLDAPRPASVK